MIFIPICTPPPLSLSVDVVAVLFCQRLVLVIQSLLVLVLSREMEYIERESFRNLRVN